MKGYFNLYGQPCLLLHDEGESSINKLSLFSTKKTIFLHPSFILSFEKEGKKYAQQGFRMNQWIKEGKKENKNALFVAFAERQKARATEKSREAIN